LPDTTAIPPAAPAVRRTARAEELPARLFARLAASRRPVRIVSIFSFVVAILVFAAGAFADRPLWSPFVMLTVFYACLWLTPAIYLFRYSRAIDHALSSPDAPAIERVLRQQLRYWRFAGGYAVVHLLLMIATAIKTSL